jgi:hypothetical protein
VITFRVKDQHQIIVPARFTRAITGFSVREAPEVDDRGFTMGTRPGTWGASDTRGPMVGLMLNFKVKVQVVREDIDDTAPLFIKSSNASIVAVRAPAGGGPLPADGIFQIEGLQDLRNAPVKIQVCLGSVDGPVLGELEPHIFTKMRIPITPHLVRIDSATATGTAPVQPVARIVERMRSIWWPCGIEITFDPATTPVINDTITLAVADQCVDIEVDNFAEMTKILGLRRRALGLPAGSRDKSINWYMIQNFGPDNSGSQTTVGVGVDRALADSLSADPGIVTTTSGVTTDAEIERVARTVAHEIGHFFTLEHVQRRNAGDPSGDIFARRQLMFPLSFFDDGSTNSSLTTVPRINDVGYGNLVRGCLLTQKDHAKHSTDGECASARRAITSNAWF